MTHQPGEFGPERVFALEDALKDALDIIDYLAPPSPAKDQPNKRARMGVESGGEESDVRGNEVTCELCGAESRVR